MTEKKKVELYALIILVIIIAVIGLYYGYNRLEGSKNLKMCRHLNSAIPKDVLLTSLGKTFRIESSDKGIILYFKNSPLAAGPIRVLVDNKTDTVIGVKCSEKSEWKYFTPLEKATD